MLYVEISIYYAQPHEKSDSAAVGKHQTVHNWSEPYEDAGLIDRKVNTHKTNPLLKCEMSWHRGAKILLLL